MKAGAAGLLASLMMAAPVAAQTSAASRAAILEEFVERGLGAAKAGVQGPFQSTFGSGGNGLVAAYLVAVRSDTAGRDSYKALLKALEARTQAQIGAPSSASGSTSVAAKGTVPKILGLAVENGALNREISGTTLTFRGTPMGIAKGLAKEGLPDLYADYASSGVQRFAARFSASASFDTSRGPAAGAFTADDRQLSAYSFRYEAINRRDPGSPEYASLWQEIADQSAAYQAAVKAIETALSGWAGFTEWQNALTKAVQAGVDDPFAKDHDTSAAAARFRQLLAVELPKLAALTSPKPVNDALDVYVNQLALVQSRISAVYELADKGALLTVEWATTRDESLPDLYTTTAIFETGLGVRRSTDFTVNVVANVYKHRPDSASSSVKSFETSLQIDHPLGNTWLLPTATATLSARYSYLPKDTTVSAAGEATAGATAIAPKGHIALVQAKLTVPIKNSGLKVPLSVTASNRTELIKEKDVRASFGVTFDLDTFLTALTAGAR